MRPPRALITYASGVALLITLAGCGSAPDGPAPTLTSRTESSSAPSVTASATPAVPRSTASNMAVIRSGRWAVGDSVMLGSKSLLVARGFRVDAKVSRQFYQAVPLVRAVLHTGTLPRNVVLHLGTNGTVSVKDCRTVALTVGPSRRLFLVTVHAPRSWTLQDNAHLRTCAAYFPVNHVIVVDWARASANRPAWFGADRIHPNSTGRKAYTSLIATVVARYAL